MEIFELEAMEDIVNEVLKYEPILRLSMAGTIIDSVVADTGMSLKEVYSMMYGLGKAVENEMGKFERRTI